MILYIIWISNKLHDDLPSSHEISLLQFSQFYFCKIPVLPTRQEKFPIESLNKKTVEYRTSQTFKDLLSDDLVPTWSLEISGAERRIVCWFEEFSVNLDKNLCSKFCLLRAKLDKFETSENFRIILKFDSWHNHMRQKLHV